MKKLPIETVVLLIFVLVVNIINLSILTKNDIRVCSISFE
jgi:hypothetical protein